MNYLFKDKCESEKDGICLSMLCLLDTDCGARNEKGEPKYDYMIGNVRAVRNEKDLTK